MKILSVLMDGFLTARKETVVRFDGLRLVAITGQNGAGKSTLFNAISWCLYEDLRIQRNKDSVVNDYCETAIVEVELVAPSGATYKVRRTRTYRGSSTLNVYMLDDSGEWIIKNDHTIASAQQVINEHIGITQDVFGSLMYVDQRYKDGTVFLNASPENRKSILMSLIPELDQWSRIAWFANENVKEIRRTRNDKVVLRDDIALEVDSMSESVKTLKLELEDLDSADALSVDIKKARSNLNRLRSKMDGEIDGLKELRLTLSSLASERAARNAERRERRATLQRAREDALRASEDVISLSDRLARVEENIEKSKKARKKAISEMNRLGKERDEIAEDREIIDERIESLVKKKSKVDAEVESIEQRIQTFEVQHDLGDDENPKCVLCESDITHARLRELEDAAEDELNDAKKRADSISRKLEDARAERKNVIQDAKDNNEEMQAAEDERRSRDSRIERYNEDLEETEARLKKAKSVLESDDYRTPESIQDEIDKIVDEDETDEEVEIREEIDSKRSTSDLSEQVEDLEAKIEDLEDDLTKVTKKEAILEERTRTLSKERTRLRDLEDEIKIISANLEDAIAIKDACSEKGVPSMLLSSILSAIETRQNEILSRITSDKIVKVEYRVERESKTGSSSKSVLDVIAHKSSGHEAQFEGLSGGERIRVMFSNMIAMIQVFNERMGGNFIRTILLDEALGPIDSPSIPMILDILNESINDGVIDSVFMVVHQPEVIDMMPQRIHVTTGTDDSAEYRIAA